MTTNLYLIFLHLQRFDLFRRDFNEHFGNFNDAYKTSINILKTIKAFQLDSIKEHHEKYVSFQSEQNPVYLVANFGAPNIYI